MKGGNEVVKKTENLINQMNFLPVNKAKTHAAGTEFEKTMKAATANSVQKENASDVAKTNGSDVTKTDAAKQTMETKEGEVVKDAAEQMKSPVQKDVVQTEPEEVTEEDVLAAMQMMVVEVKQQLMDLFHITEGQLSLAMESLNMTEHDLLVNQSLTDLTMKLSGAENPMELLFHQDITGFLKETQEKFETLVEEMKKAGLDAENILATAQEETVAPESGLLQEEVKTAVESDKPLTKENTGTNSDQQIVQTVQTGSEEKVQTETAEKNNGKQEKDLNGDTQNFSAQVLSKLEDIVSEKLPEVDVQDVVRQVVEEIKLTVKAETTSFELQLNPEHLGKINLQVAAKNGVVTAQIATETVEAKEILEAQISVLKETLNNQGVKVEAVEVSVGTKEFEQNLDGQAENQNQNGGQERQKRFRYDRMDAEEGELTSAEQIAREIMMANGNRIDYSA